MSVMDDLVPDIDRRAIELQGLLDDSHGAVDARAEASRPREQHEQFFSLALGRLDAYRVIIRFEDIFEDIYAPIFNDLSHGFAVLWL